MPKKRVKRVKSRNRSKGLPGFVYLSILAIVFLSVLTLGNSILEKKSSYLPKLVKASVPYTLKLVTVSTISPYPANYPNSNPEVKPVESGFCLHVPVLMYHHIQPEAMSVAKKQTSLSVDNGIFDQQMAYLIQNGYTPIYASDLVNALLTHTQLSGKPVLVTMDDGYADNDIYALPVLRKYGIKANLMLATGLVGNPDMLSLDQVRDLASSGLVQFTDHTWSHYPLGNGNEAKDEMEISVGKEEIKSYAGQDVNILTYPYGSFSNTAFNAARKVGIIGAFSSIPGQIQCDSFIMSLHRTHIGNASLSAYGL